MQDTACFSGPVNVPVDVMLQSPIFKRGRSQFRRHRCGHDVGSTQYVDAFQRANLWNQIDRNHYHTLLKPELAKRKDVKPGTFPIFMLYNAGMPVGSPTNIHNCCGGLPFNYSRRPDYIPDLLPV
jgi:hypothetical protein